MRPSRRMRARRPLRTWRWSVNAGWTQATRALALLNVLAVALLASIAAQTQPLAGAAAVAASVQEVPKWQPPPGEETTAIRALIDSAEKALAGGASVSKVLTDPAFDDVRPYPRFRELIRSHAPVGEVTMISLREPGEGLTLTFKLGKPGQLIYAYHTDARGAYGKNGVHIQATAGDVQYARLFAYVRTGPDGTATLHASRPIGYPHGDLPQHVHFHVEPGDTTVSEIWFSDDPRLTPAMRERGQGEALIVTPTKGPRGWIA